MKSFIIISIYVFSMLMLTACAQQKVAIDTLDANYQSKEQCNIYETRHWHIWLDKYDVSEGQYRLNITAEVDLPSPAYDLVWDMGVTDRAYPPGQRIMLTAKKRDNTMAIQAITPTKAVFQQEVPYSAYRHVSIYCAGTLLVNIPDVRMSE